MRPHARRLVLTIAVLFAAALAVIVVTGLLRSEAKPFDKTWWTYVAFFFVVTASHGFLDAFTNGGLGIAFFSPFDSTRYFFPWTPIEVSPLGLSSLLTTCWPKRLPCSMRTKC